VLFFCLLFSLHPPPPRKRLNRVIFLSFLLFFALFFVAPPRPWNFSADALDCGVSMSMSDKRELLNTLNYIKQFATGPQSHHIVASLDNGQVALR